jgi:hypothetical protein
MIGKFATVSALLLLIVTISLGGQGFAQATGSGQSPSSPDSAAQQARHATTCCAANAERSRTC